jgi:putative ABC transport system permease protein
LQQVSEGYFRVLRIPLRMGRALSEAEINDARKVAVVNETFVSTYLRGENPMGHRVKLAVLETLADPVREPWFEIVGVVADVTNNGLEASVPGSVGAVHRHRFGRAGSVGALGTRTDGANE